MLSPLPDNLLSGKCLISLFRRCSLKTLDSCSSNGISAMGTPSHITDPNSAAARTKHQIWQSWTGNCQQDSIKSISSLFAKSICLFVGRSAPTSRGTVAQRVEWTRGVEAKAVHWLRQQRQQDQQDRGPGDPGWHPRWTHLQKRIIRHCGSAFPWEVVASFSPALSGCYLIRLFPRVWTF